MLKAGRIGRPRFTAGTSDRDGAVAARITRLPDTGFGELDITSLAGRCTTSAANFNKDQQS